MGDCSNQEASGYCHHSKPWAVTVWIAAVVLPAVLPAVLPTVQCPTPFRTHLQVSSESFRDATSPASQTTTVTR